jgi:hypothetical protein
MARTHAVVAEITTEREDLAVHVDLCVERYGQIVDRLDSMDQRFDRIESVMVEIKQTLQAAESSHLNRYLTWAGVIIAGLTGIIAFLAGQLFA